MLSSADKVGVGPLLKKISELMKKAGKEVSGVNLIATFLKRRVQPLCLWDHPMWEF